MDIDPKEISQGKREVGAGEVRADQDDSQLRHSRRDSLVPLLIPRLNPPIVSVTGGFLGSACAVPVMGAGGHTFLGASSSALEEC